MTKILREAGTAIDDAIENTHRLIVLHCCLGMASAFVYWIRPGTFIPHLPTRIGLGPTFSILWETRFAWGPYVISGIFAPSVLSSRGPKPTLVFIGLSIALAIVAACLYLNVFHLRPPIDPFLISIGVTGCLMGSAQLCASCWRRFHSE
jgi:hypothetical protein